MRGETVSDISTETAVCLLDEEKAHAKRPLSIIKYRGLRILLRSLAKHLHHPEEYFGFPRQNFALSCKNVACS